VTLRAFLLGHSSQNNIKLRTRGYHLLPVVSVKSASTCTADFAQRFLTYRSSLAHDNLMHRNRQATADRRCQRIVGD